MEKQKNLISISGKIGSGKDTVAGIIQYLIWKNKVEKGEKTNLHYTFKDFTNSKFGGNTLSNWEIKRFADKLKDIVCLLLNCTREQLENREFKEKELGEQWWYYKGEVGLYPYNTLYEANKKLPLVKLTPRLLLQLLGTQCGRQIIHPHIWVNATLSDYRPYDYEKGNNKNIADVLEDIHFNTLNYPNWIITDVRFPNEAEAIRKRGGIIIRVNRLSNEVSNHESETALDDFNNFDYIIENDEGIQELIEKVRQILKREKVIS